MAFYKLIGVPQLKQENEFSCWHTSACMVLYCFEIGPRKGLPEEYRNSKTSGLPNSRFADLAEVEGLRLLRDLVDRYWDDDDDMNAAKRLGLGLNKQIKGFTFRDLARILNLFGPIWTNIGRRHIVVVTGVIGEQPGGGAVLYNDPADGSSKKMPLDEFNQLIWWEDKATMMCYPPVMYPNTRTPKRATFVSVVSAQKDIYLG